MKILNLIITLLAILCAVHGAVVAPKDDEVTNGYLCGVYCGHMVPDTWSYVHDSKMGMCNCADKSGSIIDSKQISEIRSMSAFLGF